MTYIPEVIFARFFPPEFSDGDNTLFQCFFTVPSASSSCSRPSIWRLCVTVLLWILLLEDSKLD